MKITHIIFLTFFSCITSLWAQPDKVANPLSNKTVFKEGIYGSLSDFQRNSPSQPLKTIDTWDYQIDGDTNQLFLSDATTLALKKLSNNGTLDSVWGLSIKGVPFMRVTINGNETHFVRLYIIGKISYFYYKVFQPEKVMMNVYHPFTGVLIGTRELTNRKLVMVEKMMRTENGEQTDFNLANFKKWITDDNKLLKSIDGLPEYEAQQKIFKTLLIYNDRNPVKWE